MRIRSYTQTETVEIEGGRFELAPIPHGVFTNLTLRSVASTNAANRRALIALRADGKEPSEDLVRRACMLDPEYRREVEALHREYVAWGVRGHMVEGLDFVGVEREYLGRKYPTASDETVADYADTTLESGDALLSALFLEVMRKNRTAEAEKKA